MNRSLGALAALLVVCAVLAAPAPKPSLPGWNKPLDPDKDCKISRGENSLTIEIPGTIHDFDFQRKIVNAPRLLREIEGDFEIQVRARIDNRVSAESSVKGRPSYVSAGFLVLPPDNFYSVRSEYRVDGQGEGTDGCIANLDMGAESGGISGIAPGKYHPKWPFKEKPDYVYLRLERWGNGLSFDISSDGKTWVPCGGSGWMLGRSSKLSVGLLACSTSTEPSEVRFNQLKLIPPKNRKPWDFVSGWGKPVDPDKDCKIKREKETLIIEMPGSDHDYDPVRNRFNAPRLISDLEGKFDVQVRVRIDSLLSDQSTVEGQPPFVSAGFLLIHPEKERTVCERMVFAVSQQGSRRESYAVPPRLAKPRRKNPVPKEMESDGYAVKKSWICMQQKADGIEWDRGTLRLGGHQLWERGWEKCPLPEKADYVYLRLEQRDEWSIFFISPDGEKWTALTCQKSLPSKGKLGLAAYSTSTESSKVRFDQLKLAHYK